MLEAAAEEVTSQVVLVAQAEAETVVKVELVLL
jgi:hypothetical protein